MGERTIAGPDDQEDDRMPELPDPPNEGRPSVEAAERALVRRPQIGDTMPAKPVPDSGEGATRDGDGDGDGAAPVRP
ncbi:MAG: hypothetical protein M3Z46_12340, partial [Actinomycetota bacterium]|nr:hypothetical protein [Actinomycetota bacterium]